MAARAALSRGITAQRLRKNFTFYVNELSHPTCGVHKPVILLLPWLGSRPQAVDKYCEVYFRSGFDVLVVESELLVHMSENTEYEALTRRIKGQVYDSLVVGTVERMSVGIGKVLFPYLENLVKRASLLYFAVFKRQTVDYFNYSINVFYNTPVTAPALFFSCDNDPLSDPQTVEKVIEYWQKRGMSVTAQKWEDSTHAGHLKRHPQQYLNTLQMFLQSLHIVPLKAKM
ncbi:uncharacterized protein [Brachyistius frenatus]|uniref:uncharacterized protein isoform X2 n=1 Tax=Brachyistius frenatus TaxID=100188 RepID=UPI0037E94745